MIITPKINSNQSIVIQNDCSNGDLIDVRFSVQNGVNFSELDVFWVSVRNLSNRSIPNTQKINFPRDAHVVTDGIQHIFVKNRSRQTCNLLIEIRVNSVSPSSLFPSVSATSGF